MSIPDRDGSPQDRVVPKITAAAVLFAGGIAVIPTVMLISWLAETIAGWLQ